VNKKTNLNPNPTQRKKKQRFCFVCLCLLFGSFSAVAQQQQDSAELTTANNATLYISPGTVIGNPQNLNVANATDNTLYSVGNTTVIINGTTNASIVYVPTGNNATTTSLLAKKTTKKQTTIAQLTNKAKTQAKLQPAAMVTKVPFSDENEPLKMLFSGGITITTTTTSLKKSNANAIANFSNLYATAISANATQAAKAYFIYSKVGFLQQHTAYALFSRPPTV